nr:MAG TPA: hypothetical protein [Caudoviricetes sp.]
MQMNGTPTGNIPSADKHYQPHKKEQNNKKHGVFLKIVFYGA